MASNALNGVYTGVQVIYTNETGRYIDYDVTNTVKSQGDTLTINALNGNNTINATGVGPPAPAARRATTRAWSTCISRAGSGNDTLYASPFGDTLDGGAGNDTFVGGGGHDTFIKDYVVGQINTLIEKQDADFGLTNDVLIIGTLLQDNGSQTYAQNSTFAQESSLVSAIAGPKPNFVPNDVGYRFAAGANVELLHGYFQKAVLVGGPHDSTMLVVNAPGNQFIVGNQTITTTPWNGDASLDNHSTPNSGGVTHYVVNLPIAATNTGRVDVADSGAGGTSELIVWGTTQADNITLNASGSGSFRVGTITASGTSNAQVTYRNVTRVIVNTLGAVTTRSSSNDTVVPTIVNLGNGNDNIQVGTVPTIPDPGNRTLAYPNGVPVVDTKNMTNGNSNDLFILGGGGNNRFEVDHNRALLYLYGGTGDNIFILKTFLVLRENASQPDQITNLESIFGGTGNNRYEYLQNAPVVIHGGTGRNTLVIIGTPIGDTFIVTNDYVVGAGRIANFDGIQEVDIEGSGGPETVYASCRPTPA